VQRKIGPAWTERGRPAAGYFTKRTAENWLRDTLDDARRGTLPGMVRTGATFADAAAEFLRYAEHDRACKPSTLREYRSALNAHLIPAFGAVRLEDVTPALIEDWRVSLGGSLSNRTKNKLLVVLHGVFGRAMRVCWRDVDFAAKAIRVRASYAGDQLTTPKSGKVRSVPMAPDVAETLARIGRREFLTGDDDLVFISPTGSYVEGSALRRRYVAALQRAGLRPLRFHDLRHTFGTRMIAKADTTATGAVSSRQVSLERASASRLLRVRKHKSALGR
jgi:integrase